MRGKFLSTLIVGICLLTAAVCMSSGCANPIAPSGGPRDSIPPLLVAVTPKDSALDFKEKRVTFTFNEFVQIDNVHDNLIVSPLPKSEPVIESKLRTVSIRIRDTLEENTTYSYNFGNAIKDINEGNVLKNFTYVFSTGRYIDSLELTGRVLMAQTGKADSTMIVMLHRSSDDSAVVKIKPRFIARLDSTGRYHFRNLPAGTFRLYALKDEGGQRRYTSKSQAFAFADNPIITGKNTTADTLYAYLEKTDEKPVPPPVKPVATTKADRDKEKEKEKDKRLKFTINLDNGQQDLLGDLVFSFNDPLRNFDSSKIRFTDSSYKDLAGYRLTKDSTNKKVTLAYKWADNMDYRLIVDKEFAEDSTGRKIPRTDTLRFKTKKEADYGNLTIQFRHLDLSKKPVLQLIQGDNVKFSVKLSNASFRDRLFRPGEYEIRILFDTNDNGSWDPGEFFGKHRQPEKVLNIQRKLNVKANWDNDTTVEL